jgi:DNA-binding Lrp family transcriptional regulator
MADHDLGEPLSALEDIGLVRRLLDNAELSAVKAARRQRKSWAEIATKLGVTRQSAWERWRDLDDADEASTGEGAVIGLAASDAVSASSVRRSGRDIARTTLNSVVVPDVIGMSFDQAR